LAKRRVIDRLFNVGKLSARQIAKRVRLVIVLYTRIKTRLKCSDKRRVGKVGRGHCYRIVKVGLSYCVYDAFRADELSKARNGRRGYSKKEKNELLLSIVKFLLKYSWKPDVIAGWLKEYVYPGDESMHISQGLYITEYIILEG
jgi:IS30 family transposase